MHKLTRRSFLGTVAAGTTAAAFPPLAAKANTRIPDLVPRKLPFTPNDDFGSMEPALSADNNTIYFARFGNNGDPAIKSKSDIFVVNRERQEKQWPGVDGDWSVPQRLPDAVNGDVADHGSSVINLEPSLTPDGNTLYFMSNRPGAGGSFGIWESQKLPDGGWSEAQPVSVGNVNSPHDNHCFIPFNLPGQPEAQSFISFRPRENGAPGAADLYTTRKVDGVWQPAERYDDRLLDSIALKCRFNPVTVDDFTLGVVSVHEFDKFHIMVFVHYDPETRQWKGPVVEAPFNEWNIDGSCPNFSLDGELMIWSAGYDRGPGIISGTTGDGDVYDLFWLPTREVIAFYKAHAGIG